MDYQIVFTPEQVYKFLLALAGFIIAVAGAVKVISEAIKKLKAPDEEQKKRISGLEDRMTRAEEALNAIQSQSKRTEEIWQLFMKSMLALLAHSIDGNHVEDLKEAREDLNAFLISQGVKYKE